MVHLLKIYTINHSHYHDLVSSTKWDVRNISIHYAKKRHVYKTATLKVYTERKMNGRKCSRTHLHEQGKIQDCSNYLRIKRMSHTYKLWKRVTKICTQRQNSIEPIRNYAKRSKIEAIHLMRQRTDYYTARKRDLHVVFIDWKKHMIRY